MKSDYQMFPLVLSYHRLVTRKQLLKYPRSVGKTLDMPLSKFKSQLRILEQMGFTIADPIYLTSKRDNADRSFIFITFDDGYYDTMINVEKAFEAKYKFLMFLTGISFHSNHTLYSWDMHHTDKTRCNVVKVDQLDSFKSFRYGWHSWSHNSLNTCKSEVLKELTMPSHDLMLPLFAWPYGHVKKDLNDQAVQVCESKFKKGFTLFGGMDKFKTNRSSAMIPRLYISRYWSQKEFEIRVRQHGEFLIS